MRRIRYDAATARNVMLAVFAAITILLLILERC